MYPQKDGSPYEYVESWRGHGVTAKMIEVFARPQGMTLYMRWNNIVIKTSFVPGVRTHREVLAMCISGDHGFFYEYSNVKKSHCQDERQRSSNCSHEQVGSRSAFGATGDHDPYDKWRFVTVVCQMEKPGHV